MSPVITSGLKITRADDGPYEVEAWDGERVIQYSAWAEAVINGEKVHGPTLQARRRGELSPYLTDQQKEDIRKEMHDMKVRSMANRPMSTWEKYVSEFINKYHLDDQQSQKAISILRDCQQQGHRYLNSNSAKFYKLQRQLQQARESRDIEQLKKWHSAEQKLRQPVDHITSTSSNLDSKNYRSEHSVRKRSRARDSNRRIPR